jgi:molybdate-binding protein
MTHFEVACAISKGQEEDVELGVETAALSFGTDFKLLTTEGYDWLSLLKMRIEICAGISTMAG